MQNAKRFCPCCTFDLDLFLPDSERQRTVDPDENDGAPASLPNVTETFQQLISLSRESSLPVVIVDTHGHAQLDRDRDEAYELEPNNNHADAEEKETDLRELNFHVKSLACSVEPDDFDVTLKYASTSDSILPALGVHPWYIENLPNYSSETPTDANTNTEGPSDIDLDSEWLFPMEDLLLAHPNCLVGEIGLCKIAKWVRTHPDGKARAMEIQKRVFQKQMVLAAKLRRPVSVHCVNSHGIFVDAIKELVEIKKIDDDNTTINNNSNPNNTDGESRRFLLPPAIGMHSFTGTAHHVKELLELEHQIDFPNDRSRTMRKKKKGSKNDKTPDTDGTSPPPRPPLFYFGFSHTVNYAMCTSEKSRKKGKEAVEAVPLDRLLVESDVHSDADVAGGTIGAISYVSWARDMQVKDVVRETTKNGSMFLGSIGC